MELHFVVENDNNNNKTTSSDHSTENIKGPLHSQTFPILIHKMAFVDKMTGTLPKALWILIGLFESIHTGWSKFKGVRPKGQLQEKSVSVPEPPPLEIACFHHFLPWTF